MRRPPPGDGGGEGGRPAHRQGWPVRQRAADRPATEPHIDEEEAGLGPQRRRETSNRLVGVEPGGSRRQKRDVPRGSAPASSGPRSVVSAGRTITHLRREPIMARTLIKGGTVVTATETIAADVLIDGEKVVAIYARGAGGRPSSRPPTRSSTPPASTSSPAPSTSTPTSICRLAAPMCRMTSRPGPGRRPRRHHDHRRLRRAGEGRIASWTASTPGWQRQKGNCAIDYGFHMIVGDVNDADSQGDGCDRR